LFGGAVYFHGSQSTGKLHFRQVAKLIRDGNLPPSGIPGEGRRYNAFQGLMVAAPIPSKSFVFRVTMVRS
jgi:hypothetical protein